MHARLRDPNKMFHQIIHRTWFILFSRDEIAEPRPDMNIELPPLQSAKISLLQYN